MGRRRGGDKLFQNRKKELNKGDFNRGKATKSTIPDIIIACEDSVSSPTYFQMIIDHLIKDKKITQDSVVIVPHDGSTHPTGVLNNLKTYKDDNKKTYKDFEHKWIVIDRDIERVNGGGHTAEDFNNALNNAKSQRRDTNVEVAYANDSFELWYLLHFDYRTTAIIRDEIIEKVIERLKREEAYIFSSLSKETIKEENYTKLIFKTLIDRQSSAIRNATRLLESYENDHNPEQDNPSTTIHLLINVLNSLQIGTQ